MCGRDVAVVRRGVVLFHLALTRLNAIASTLCLARRRRCRKELEHGQSGYHDLVGVLDGSGGGRLWLMPAVLLLGQFMGLLYVTIVNVAVPAIGADLHASGALLQLVVGGYTVADILATR
jgi:hypothetical protein